MSVHVIKAITRRMRQRYGSAENAALAAGLKNKGKWSLYESDEHPETTLPLHRFLLAANADEKRALVDLLKAEVGDAPDCPMTEASETTEASADLQRAVREAAADGKITTLEARQIVRKAVEVQAQAADVIASVGGQ